MGCGVGGVSGKSYIQEENKLHLRDKKIQLNLIPCLLITPSSRLTSPQLQCFLGYRVHESHDLSARSAGMKYVDAHPRSTNSHFPPLSRGMFL